jgi:hypothetical protein
MLDHFSDLNGRAVTDHLPGAPHLAGLFAPEFAVIVVNQSIIGECRRETANIEGVGPGDELNDVERQLV